MLIHGRERARLMVPEARALIVDFHMAENRRSTLAPRLLLIGSAPEIATALSGKHAEIRQVSDCEEALRVIAEQGTDVLIVAPVSLTDSTALPIAAEPEAIQKLGYLITALARGTRLCRRIGESVA